MRHGRAKAARRTLQFFRLNAGISPPYHVLCDGCFLVAMISQKVPLVDRLDKLLQHSHFTLYVTRSSLDELKSLYEQTSKEIFQQARQWGLDECEILEKKEQISSSTTRADDEKEDSASLGNAGTDILRLVSLSSSPSTSIEKQQQQHHHARVHRHHYMVCTQDETLLDTLRKRGTVPLIRLARGVVLLEHPSKASYQRASKEERSKWTHDAVNEHERALVQHVTQKNDNRESSSSSRPQQQRQQRVKPKAKGPNPLSCKKKRTATEKDGSSTPRKRKRRRKHKAGEETS